MLNTILNQNALGTSSYSPISILFSSSSSFFSFCLFFFAWFFISMSVCGRMNACVFACGLKCLTSTCNQFSHENNRKVWTKKKIWTKLLLMMMVLYMRKSCNFYYLIFLSTIFVLCMFMRLNRHKDPVSFHSMSFLFVFIKSFFNLFSFFLCVCSFSCNFCVAG